MSDLLKLTSSIPPSVNHYLAYRTTFRNGKAVAMSYKTADAKKYRKDFADYVASEVQRQMWNVSLNAKQHFYIDGWFYFSRIDADPNNYWKILIDAITDTQKIWVDDNVVCERVQRIQYDPSNPRIELTITPVEYIGIFDNTEQANCFVQSNCIGCRRYKRNCSILRKAMDGRVQDGVTQTSCHVSCGKSDSNERKNKNEGN